MSRTTLFTRKHRGPSAKSIARSVEPGGLVVGKSAQRAFERRALVDCDCAAYVFVHELGDDLVAVLICEPGARFALRLDRRIVRCTHFGGDPADIPPAPITSNQAARTGHRPVPKALVKAKAVLTRETCR
jgi:hypothetical protein